MTERRLPKERRQNQWESDQRIAQLQKDLIEARREVNENTAITNSIKINVQELLDLLATAKRAIAFFIIVGRILMWFGGIAGALGLIWGLIFAVRHGGPPSIKN